MKKFAIGVDVGGSHLSCAAVNLEKVVIVENSHSSVDVDNKASAKEILDSWASALLNTINKIGIKNLAGIGFGMPGPFEYDKGIARFAQVEKYYSLNGVDVAGELAHRLNIELPLRFMNDASAFAAGEAWLGSASHVAHSVSITLGTGFGSAFISEGVPVVDGEQVPSMGCVWHLPYKEGIADDYFSTRWFVKRYFEEAGKKVDGVREIAEESATNIKAKSLFVEYGRNIGEFFSPWLKKFNAGVLVVGGNIAGAYTLFGPYFEEALKNNGIKTEIRISKLKEDAAIIGSARMVDEDFWVKVKDVIKKM